MEMTPKVRLERLLSGEGADRPACICPGGMMNMITRDLQEERDIYLPEAHSNARMMADLAKAVCDMGCFENLGVPFCMTVEAEAMGAGVTMGTRLFEPHVTEYVINDIQAYPQLSRLDPGKGRAKVVVDAIRILKEETRDLPIIGNLTGPVSTASSVMEPQIYYKQLRKKRDIAHQYMDFITDQLITFGLAQAEAGADVITIADPSGTGEILGPKYFDEFAVTYLNKLIDGLRPSGVKIIVHICGQMHSVYEEVQKVRSDALSFDAVVSIREARKKLPGRAIMGNVSTFAVEMSDRDDVERLTEGCLNAGSDIISPACGLGMGSPLENVRAILRTVQKEG
ncbi:[methyl-Co(III) methanol-specific corrinoid protein]:coenzyme M methyltransferase [Eubacterium pyruvativorans]|uniref:[methyl-Co(III) methanol-specific corrinoid protein]:coenzyme M methyltransferase n=2 Tax=Eubacterium pyruvativorans TaxID=155865 RepID=A0A1I7IBR9_9FIRM|nr:[methyl-Co(III) methanol-specific corrinoid protein]:coenzyme M methyltransferase [Eubacterium pyruvativorans]SFO40108.1 [methyl-Co(III) methanol-specific corrinoid protein]:coenzyme M methyltransferase [Eubacterium pyruvativorans]SFU70230.1 [methyl-Co(III) methanol-specific corrinoid protein]:coenzyme M methyltransferase [Eubacterium pyruvativorans]